MYKNSHNPLSRCGATHEGHQNLTLRWENNVYRGVQQIKWVWFHQLHGRGYKSANQASHMDHLLNILLSDECNIERVISTIPGGGVFTVYPFLNGQYWSSCMFLHDSSFTQSTYIERRRRDLEESNSVAHGHHAHQT